MTDPDAPKRVTIYEVARAAGVSITTVSHALNRPERVRAETRERVLRVADELDFVPDRVAADRSRRGANRVAVLAPFGAYATYRERLVGVLDVLGQSGVDVVVFDHSPVDSDLSPLLKALPISGRVEGLIVMGIPLSDEMASRLADRRLPTVLVDAKHPAFPSVNVDDEAGGRAAIEHLLARGHRRVAYVSGPQSSAAYVSPGLLRLRGIEAALGERGMGFDAMPLVLTDPSFDGGRGAAAHLRQTYPDVSAVICHFDEIAAGVLRGAADHAVSVPQDLAVVGYDDGLLAAALDLTTVAQPFQATGEVAARLLATHLESGPGAPEHVMLTPELRQRGTT